MKSAIWSYLFTRPKKTFSREAFTLITKLIRASTLSDGLNPNHMHGVGSTDANSFMGVLTTTAEGVILFRFGKVDNMLHPRTGRQLLQHEHRDKPLTPRIRLATRLYATGVAKTKAQAAEMAGLAPSTFYITSVTENQVTDLMNKIDRELEDEHLDMGRLLKQVGRRAVRHIAWTMESDEVKHEVRLKAAQDLADRSPETSKSTNINLGLNAGLTDTQVASLRDAMLEAAAMKEKFASAAQGNYVTVSDAGTARSLDLVKERAPLALPSGGNSEPPASEPLKASA